MSDSDDIEIVERTFVDKSFSENDICQLCSAKLHGLSASEREHHYYNEHGSGQSTGSLPKHRKLQPPSVIISQPARKPPPTKPVKAKNSVQQDVFWFPAQSNAPPDNYTPDVLPLLKQALKEACKKGHTQRAVLCYERTPHIQRESFDTSWGCGYRNFLMACAALLDQQAQTVYFPHLDSPSPPGVRNLQHWIEDAWKHGYDEIGARELDYKLVDTNKKIGTAELYVAFTSRKIPCVLVDFDLNKSPKGFDMVTEWVVNHFTEKPEGDVNQILRATTPVVATTKMPVIMQYDGHSVTIVGYELGKSGKYSLLAFDPSSKVPREIRDVALDPTARVNWESSGKGKRRERSRSPAPRKRSRTDQDPDDGVVSIPDSDDDGARRVVVCESTLDPERVIKAFRLKKKKKQEFQLLYFTMGDPLSDQEQDACKVVLAEC